jgi:hypothetical protein
VVHAVRGLPDPRVSRNLRGCTTVPNLPLAERKTIPRKLFIYDETGFEDRWQAHGRFRSDDDDVVTLPVGSRQDAVDGLDKLLSKGMVFDRMLIQSHGDHGLIWFGKNQIISSDWKSSFGDGNYDESFPTYSRIYFDGCDVAAGGMGVEFLRAAGRVFLKGMGGEVIGWTSFGLGLPGCIPFVGGHTVHPAGHLVRVRFAPGDDDGTVIDEPSEVVLPYPGT